MAKAPQPFHRPIRLEREYRKTLNELVREWVTIARIGDISSIDDLFFWMNQFSNYKPLHSLDRIARGMVTGVAKGNAISWRAAAMETTKGRRIYELLRTEMKGPVGRRIEGLVAYNATLISTLPARIASETTKQIATRQLRGERASTIASDMRARMPYIADTVINRIARTEVAKCNEAIIRARAQALDLNWYQWLTSKDIRVRESHRNMSDVLVNFNDPPSPEALVGEKNVGHYNAGNIWNCRCPSAVIVDLDQVTWPARVYRNGRITRMSRLAFSKIAGGSVER